MRPGVTGDREVVAALRALGKSITARDVDGAANDALRPMQNDIVRNASRLTNRRLGKHLANRWIVRRISKVGTRFRYWLGASGRAIRVAHLFEFGIARHSMAPGARRREGILQDVPPIHPGRARTPIARPAYDTNAQKTVQRFGTALWARVERSIIRSVGTFRRRR